MVRFETSLGVFTVELDARLAPVSSENFLRYVDDGHFDGTVFHRVIPGFMIQGGGFAADMTQKPARKPISNEAANGLRNIRGSLAMARTNDINSASAQFFVNLVDNAFLDHRPGNFGYAVFGRVVDGVDVIDRIAAVRTGRKHGHDDVPVEPVVVTAARRIDAA